MPDLAQRPNDLEMAVLHRMAAAVPTFTNFEVDADFLPWDQHIGIDVLIEIPGLEYGLDAVLFCCGDRPIFLELVSFGEPWDGAIQGFQLKC
jgi:hypothetical protein